MMMLGTTGIFETIMITMVMEKLLNQAPEKVTDVEIGVSMNSASMIMVIQNI